MADPGSKRGMVFSAASAVLFGVTPAVASRIYSMGGNAVTLTFYRNLMAVPVLLALLGLEGVSLRLTRREAGLLLLMGASFRVTTTLMLYQSYLYIPTGMATTLHFLYPALTALLCRARFRERLGPWKLFALGLSGLGALCLLELGAGTDPRGVLLASSSALTYACYLIGLDKTALRDMHPHKAACYMGLLNAAAMLAVSLPTHQLRLALPPAALGLSFLLAVSTSFLAVSLLQWGIRLLGASSAALFSMLEPITSVAVGCLALAESVSRRSLLGCALILAGVALTALAGQRQAVEK